ncbi:hypothetical protein HDV00_012538 [Rhizophlyctis rosea]|nr:hypothetical protein HDV00_012538 [Rhizophlyctis rosea]
MPPDTTDGWTYPYTDLPPTHPLHVTPHQSLRYGEIDEGEAREMDLNARDKAVSLLIKAGLPQLHAPDEEYDSAKLVVLAKGLDTTVRQASGFWGAAVVAYVPWNVLRGLDPL